MPRHSERTVAIVNGLVVLLLPLACAIAVVLLTFDSDTAVTVYPPGGPRLAFLVPYVFSVGMTMLPFAALAAWRSWVYARKWREQHDRGWRAVAEAGVCGLSVCILMLLPSIITRPREAPPYVIVYGSVALVLGLLVGLFLRMTAIAVLALQRSTAVGTGEA